MSAHPSPSLSDAAERPHVQPLETVYSGVVFRSRLEARWAVFLDVLLVKWHYEYEGFALRVSPEETLHYLPDFWLPEMETWLEIKPGQPTELERKKCEWLAYHTGKRVVLFMGEPVEGSPSLAFLPFDDASGRHVAGDDGFSFCLCSSCMRIGLEYEGRGDRICRHDSGDRGHSSDDPVILAAYRAARRHRFWNPKERG